MPRRRVRSGSPVSRPGSVLLAGNRSSPRRRRPLRFGGSGSGRGLPWRALAAVLVLAAVVAGASMWRSHAQAREDRRAAAVRFVTSWEQRDHAAMWRALTPRARAAYPQDSFTASYRGAERTARLRSVRAGTIGDERDGSASVVVEAALRGGGSLRGTIVLSLAGRTTRASTGARRCAF